MNPETVFRLCNNLALAGWVLLIFVGYKRWVPALLTGAVVPLTLAFLYGTLLFSHWGETKGNFSSLAGVAILFSNQWLLLAGWIHYLAFDLFIGSWQARDAHRMGISHWLIVPCLMLTFLFGPVGLLLYFALRFALRRSFAIVEGEPQAVRTY